MNNIKNKESAKYFILIFIKYQFLSYTISIKISKIIYSLQITYLKSPTYTQCHAQSKLLADDLNRFQLFVLALK